MPDTLAEIRARAAGGPGWDDMAINDRHDLLARLDALAVSHTKALGWHHRQLMTTARNCSYCWNHRREPHDD